MKVRMEAAMKLGMVDDFLKLWVVIRRFHLKNAPGRSKHLKYPPKKDGLGLKFDTSR